MHALLISVGQSRTLGPVESGERPGHGTSARKYTGKGKAVLVTGREGP